MPRPVPPKVALEALELRQPRRTASGYPRPRPWPLIADEMARRGHGRFTPGDLAAAVGALPLQDHPLAPLPRAEVDRLEGHLRAAWQAEFPRAEYPGHAEAQRRLRAHHMPTPTSAPTPPNPSVIHSVALVVDRAFGDRLSALARRLHVWVVDSPLNRPARDRVWSESPEYVLESGATIFADDGNAPDLLAARILGDVELHHGQYSHSPPLSRIELYGTRLTPALQDALHDLGFASFEDTADGFIAVRP